MLENTFQAILVISGIGLLMTGILSAIKLLVRRRFSAGWFYYIWLLVLVAMLVPAMINWKEMQSSMILSGMVSVTEDYLPLQEIREVGALFRAEAKEIYDDAGHRLLSTALLEKRIREIAFEQNLNWLSRIWLVGAGLLLGLRLVSYGYYLGKIRRTTKVCVLPEVAEYTRRIVTVRKGAWIPSPMLLGVFRPILLLPERELTEEQLRYVLAHEMTHLRRNDMLVKWVMVLVKSVHWFNPLVYWLEKQVEQECEISCDIAVTEQMGAVEKKAYADTILMFLAGQRKREFSLSMGMAGTKGLLKKRFLRMKKATVISRNMKVCSGLVTGVLLLASVVISGNLMNQTFPYTGESSYTSSCSKCKLANRFLGHTETSVYDNSSSPGVYMQSIYECPKCGGISSQMHFVREFTAAEWAVYEEDMQELRRIQEEKWWQIKAEIEAN